MATEIGESRVMRLNRRKPPTKNWRRGQAGMPAKFLRRPLGSITDDAGRIPRRSSDYDPRLPAD
jgi:hypothetical protein